MAAKYNIVTLFILQSKEHGFVANLYKKYVQVEKKHIQ